MTMNEPSEDQTADIDQLYYNEIGPEEFDTSDPFDIEYDREADYWKWSDRL